MTTQATSNNFTFYLGVHEPHWLAEEPIPFFISAVRLRRLKTYPKALCPWALDSGGFSELSLRGEWTVSSLRYAREVERWQQAIGNLEWAAIQDWMCEPFILKKTGLTIQQHQARTIANYKELTCMSPKISWVPVIQGWHVNDYLKHIDDYNRAGFDLSKLPRVGVGSVCRRQNTDEGYHIIKTIAARGIKVHAFGFKIDGLSKSHKHLVSSDSMAWSDGARKLWLMMPGCRHGALVYRKNLGRVEWGACNNCIRYALHWRSKVLNALLTNTQLEDKLYQARGQPSIWE